MLKDVYSALSRLPNLKISLTPYMKQLEEELESEDTERLQRKVKESEDFINSLEYLSSWNNPKGLSVNWDSRESRTKGDRPKALAIGSGGDLSGWVGEKPSELDWSSLAGTCGLIYYCICMYMFILDLLMSVLEYSGV